MFTRTGKNNCCKIPTSYLYSRSLVLVRVREYLITYDCTVLVTRTRFSTGIKTARDGCYLKQVWIIINFFFNLNNFINNALYLLIFNIYFDKNDEFSDGGPGLEPVQIKPQRIKIRLTPSKSVIFVKRKCLSNINFFQKSVKLWKESCSLIICGLILYMHEERVTIITCFTGLNYGCNILSDSQLRNVMVFYKIAKNFPLDLYFLNDPSYTMRQLTSSLNLLANDIGKRS